MDTELLRGLELPTPGRPLPAFTLPDTSGGATRLWSLKQRHPLLLAFLHGADCARCRAWLAALATHRAQLAELDAVVLIVMPEPIERLRMVRATLDLPFALLTDEDRAVAGVYVPATATSGVTLYAGDRYLQCLARWMADDADTLPTLDVPLTTLVAAEQEDCGCGLPAWPEE